MQLFSRRKAPQTSDFFDFLADLGYKPRDVMRMNWRYRHIVAPIKADLVGARVLDLGSHDGRWPFAFAEAGATVIGIEGRGELIAQFAHFPDPPKERITLIEGDFIREMDRLYECGERFDVVACLGVYYHTMHHYLMMTQMARFSPKIIIIDSIFNLAQWPMIAMVKERTDNRLNTIAQTAGQAWAPIGNPSRPAVELMASSVGYAVEWVEWRVPQAQAQRQGVADYFKHPKNRNIRRFTAFLRPVTQS